MYQRIVAAFLVLSLAILPFMGFAVPAAEFSEMENRSLQQWPKFSVGSLLSAEYMQDLGSYVQDQFWQRSWWVRLKNGSENLLGRKDIGNAYLGPQYGTYVEKRAAVDAALWAKNVTALQEFCAWSDSQAVRNWFLGVYSSGTVYPQWLPDDAPYADERGLAAQLAALEAPLTFIDPWPQLQQEAQSSDALYFRTDHHWTALGAYQGYLALMDAMQMPAKPLSDFDEGRIDGFLGTLFSRAPLFGVEADELRYFTDSEVELTMRIGLQEEVHKSLIIEENKAKKDKYTIFLGGVQPLLTIRTDVENGKRLLILKDSFAHPLLPFLASHFEEIHVIDLRYFKASLQDYLVEQRMTDLLCIYNLSWFAGDSFFAAIEPD